MLFGQEHVDRYRETDGEEGHDWNGLTVLILTTKGRKSGEDRATPLVYGQNGDDYLIVASNEGQDAAPAWFLNLQSDPEVEVQVKADRFKARARVAGPEEKPDLWETMVERNSDYEDYQKKTERKIPVIVLERT